MKRLIAGIILIAAALTTGIIAQISVNGYCDRITEQLKHIESSAANEDISAFKQNVKEAQESWNKMKTVFHILMDHDEIRDLEASMKELSLCAEKNEAEKGAEICDECIAYVGHIRDSVGLTVSNVLTAGKICKSS